MWKNGAQQQCIFVSLAQSPEKKKKKKKKRRWALVDPHPHTIPFYF